MELLSPGVITTLAEDVVYALPASRCKLFSHSGAELLQSNDPAFATSIAITLTDGMAEVCGGFIQTTARDGAVIKLAKF